MAVMMAIEDGFEEGRAASITPAHEDCGVVEADGEVVPAAGVQVFLVAVVSPFSKHVGPSPWWRVGESGNGSMFPP